MKKVLLLLMVTLFTQNLIAQDMLGFRSSNYSGIQGLGINPASIHNSRLDIDINLISFGITAENDFLYIPKEDLKFFGIKNIMNKFNDKEYLDDYFKNDPNELYNASVHQSIAGPGVMFNINNKHTFAVTSAARTGVVAHNVQGHAAKYAVEGLGYDTLHNQLFEAKDFNLNIMGWVEYGLSYATTLYENDKGALTGGFTVKFLQGIGGAYAKNVDIYYNVLNDSDMVFGQGNFSEIDYGRTDYSSFDDIKGYSDAMNGGGYGFDLGFTYDFLKDPATWKYEMDGKMETDPTVNRYKLRIGASILDVGKIKFKDNSNTYHLETTYGYYPDYDVDEFDDNIDFDESMSGIFYNGDSTASYRTDNFSLSLPTSLNINVDWNIHKKWYVNAGYLYGFQHHESGVVRPSVFSVTPRYETKWFDASLPISYLSYTGKVSRVGLAVRFASFFIGSDRIGTLFGLSDLNGMDVYIGLKFSINKERIRDYDGDRVSDKMDKCREVAGVLKFEGCPDRDKDDVPDATDKCPDIPGLASLEGCPDRDGDGITDLKDTCPDAAGILKFFGCPDTDSDNIQDKEDECPTVAGLEIFRGCPDTDGDSIPDPKDDCPTVAGPASNKGCPVKIVVAPVKVEPVAATLTAEEREVINKVFSNLQFETGKAVIKSSSYASLDGLALLMKKRPTFKLQIDGHTDNVGSAAMNKTLSEKRAKAAQTYLEKQGVEPGRITARGFGEDKPVATNSTAEGKAKNRRVEFLILE